MTSFYVVDPKSWKKERYLATIYSLKADKNTTLIGNYKYLEVSTSVSLPECFEGKKLKALSQLRSYKID